MSEFDVLSKAMTAHINKMLESSQDLFVVDANPDELWTLYLRSFPPGTDPIFRTRTDHDCSSCRHFMRTFGNVVTIKNNMITSIWDFADTLPEGMNPIMGEFFEYYNMERGFHPNALPGFTESSTMGFTNFPMTVSNNRKNQTKLMVGGSNTFFT